MSSVVMAMHHLAVFLRSKLRIPALCSNQTSQHVNLSKQVSNLYTTLTVIALNVLNVLVEREVTMFQMMSESRSRMCAASKWVKNSVPGR